MKVIQHIKEFGWDSLPPLGIKITKHRTLPLYLLNYEQWAEKFDPKVMESRGLVLDANLNVLCKPMLRFFNLCEVECDRDFASATAYEKLDGSMVNVWFNPYINSWSISTRNSFGDAQTGWGNTFDSVVRPLLTEVVEGYTHVFEFTSPENRVITPYREYKLHYITSVRNDGTEHEVLRQYATPTEYKFTSVSEINEAFKFLPETEEGYVVKWPDGFRLKVKNPAYLALSRTKGVHFRNSGNGALSERRAMEIYFEGSSEEYLACYPEDAPLFTFVDKWNEVVESAAKIKENAVISSDLSQAEKAKYIKSVFSGVNQKVAFAVLAGKDPKVYLHSLPVRTKLALCISS